LEYGTVFPELKHHTVKTYGRVDVKFIAVL
jgi:hypothetical protein